MRVKYKYFTIPFFLVNGNKFPMLKKIKNLFVTTATSVPSDALFSAAGDVITANRNRLKPETAEMIIICKNKVQLSLKFFSNFFKQMNRFFFKY